MTQATTGTSLDHAVGADGLVSISLPDGEIRLRAVDGETVRIHDRSGTDLGTMFTIERAEGSLALTAIRHDRLGHGLRGHSSDLDVDVPRRATIVIETASAEIESDGLLGDQRYRTTSGEVTLRSVAGKIDVEAVSGDVDILAAGDADASVRTVSGDIALRAGTLRSLVVTSTSGDIKVAGRLAGPGPFSIETVSGDGLLAPAGDLRIEMTTMSGDLQSDVEAQAGGSRGRRSLAIGSNGPLLAFRSMSGDLRVVRPKTVVAPVAPAAPPPPAPPAAPPPAPQAGQPVEPAGPPVSNGAIALAYDDARLRILKSLERGEIDVAEAGRRLEALDDGDPSGAEGHDSAAADA